MENMTVTATNLRRHMQGALRVAERGGRVLITRHGRVVAVLSAPDAQTALLHIPDGEDNGLVAPPQDTGPAVQPPEPVSFERMSAAAKPPQPTPPPAASPPPPAVPNRLKFITDL